jgi:hypothetical protein
VNTTLLVVGFVFVAAAVIGGGLKAVGIEVPVVSSISRQVLLGLAGVGAIVISFLLAENDPTLGGTGTLPTTVSLPPAHFPPPAVTLKNRHDRETLCVAYVDGGGEDGPVRERGQSLPHRDGAPTSQRLRTVHVRCSARA